MKKANKFPYKRVKIYWVDIVSNSEWMSLDKAKDQVYSWCEDTGYLLYKDHHPATEGFYNVFLKCKSNKKHFLFFNYFIHCHKQNFLKSNGHVFSL